LSELPEHVRRNREEWSSWAAEYAAEAPAAWAAAGFPGRSGYPGAVREAGLALLAMGTEAPASGILPVLYARLDAAEPPAATPEFTRELDVRILRVVPRMPGSPIYVPNLPAPVSAAAPTIGASSPPRSREDVLRDLAGHTGLMTGLPETGGAP